MFAWERMDVVETFMRNLIVVGNNQEILGDNIVTQQAQSHDLWLRNSVLVSTFTIQPLV